MYAFIKRTIDILASLAVLLILGPFFLIIMFLLRITGEGEIFYKQERVGYKNQIFKIWKFATMLKNSPNMGTKDITLRNDPRVTLMGKYLRITKFNELPQVINILIGDMTLVGPRPLMKRGFDGYADEYKKSIYNSRPGLTGIGSVVFRDEEKIMTDSDLEPRECYEKVILPYKGELELWYQEHKSLLTDFKLIFLTAWTIFFPKIELHHKLLKDLPKRKL